jgi:hypothetical protein
MKTLLIVDNTSDSPLTRIPDLFPPRTDICVLTASSVTQAIELLKEKHVDLIVTDTTTAGMGPLPAHLKHHHPGIPVFAKADPEAREPHEELKASVISYIFPEPVDLEMIAARILDEFDAAAAGQIHSVSLSSFLQLVEMENRTCTLTIRPRDGAHKGRLHFFRGELFAAETGDLEHEAAAYEILGWEKASILIQNTCRKTEKQLSEPLMKILIKANRREDEKSAPFSRPGKEAGDRKRKTVDVVSSKAGPLIEALHAVSGLVGYGVYDEKNRAIAVNGAPLLSTGALETSKVFAPFQSAAGSRRDKAYLLFHTNQGDQLLLFEREGLRAIAGLEPGYSAGEVVKKLNLLL